MVYVFKTAVNTQDEVKQLSPLLNNFLNDSNWNFDLDDCDRVLRIESQNDVSNSIPELMRDMGFMCEELLS